ncbi:DUF2335 domain-containing protein [Aeromonas schubertii]|uniref:DUF2335 domain-containing protein n=1 Tax=Aeromonas schubertii TaxID=652 RepID=A0ABS7VGH6_9GAMM|nr:DUF2335 domain-containing protein [Aeromonas schubertii]MBZ6068494.1 DUF2335 domain-containing protein [Aeromonas schubertii]
MQNDDNSGLSQVDTQVVSEGVDDKHLVDRLEHELMENPDPELVERIEHSEPIKKVFVSEMHQGPLPPARAMADYEQVLPGAAERIMSMAEREQAHRHQYQNQQLSQQKEVVDSYIRQDTTGKWMGFVVAMSVLALACLMAVLGHGVLAGILAGLDLVGLTAVFVVGRYTSRNEKQNTGEESE